MLLRRPIVSLSAAVCKTFLALGCKSVTVKGLAPFLEHLENLDARNVPLSKSDLPAKADAANDAASRQRLKRPRGILTYANHISVLDEPTLWGCMPSRIFAREETTRWTLGASDIMFTNKFFSSFFRQGQVIETERGRGIFQPALDIALSKLEAGQWVHLFPEGYVNLSRTAELRRFKWGVGRLLAELDPDARPVVVPMWISGFDRIMPEGRAFPRFLPRLGAEVTITFGEPINSRLDPFLDALLAGREETPIERPAWLSPSIPPPQRRRVLHPAPTGGWPELDPDSRAARALASDSPALQRVRERIAAFLRTELSALASRVRQDQGFEGGDYGALSHKDVLEDEWQAELARRRETEGGK